jgi:hypothetical protein
VNVPASDTVEKIKQLMLWGYPKALISRDALGNTTQGLQVQSIRRPHISTTTVRTAVYIRDFYRLIEAMRSAWGSIPPRHYVYWKRRRGRHPETPAKKHLEIRRFAVTYDYTVLWPKELKEASSLAGKLKREIRERRKNDA